jgi:hypothetical protein
MEPVAGTEIRDFRIRGNYINQHSLLSRRELHSSKRENLVRLRLGQGRFFRVRRDELLSGR